MYLPNSKFSFNFKKIKSEKNTEPGLFRLKLSMFFPFQFFWAFGLVLQILDSNFGFSGSGIGRSSK